jgi:apolipoprotein N-acyltransferase
MEMTASTMNQTPRSRDRSVREIIESARSVRKQAIPRVGMLGALAMSGLSGLLMWLSFTPVNASAVAWIALVPLMLLVRIEQRTRLMYVAIYLTSLITQLALLQWMRLGDPTMYIAWMALSVYLALYAAAFVAISRIAVHRWSIPLAVAAPIVWTGTEYLRAHLMTGIAWYFLSHTQYRWLELIQISDIFGAYGVSFVIVMSGSALTLMIPHSWLIRLRLALPSTGPTTAPGLTLSQLVQITLSLAVLGTALGYGFMRRSQAEFTQGPRVALIQGNFVASLRQAQPSEYDVLRTHLRLNAHAVRQQPQLIVWPEGMFPYALFSAPKEMTGEQLQDLAPMVDPRMWSDETSKSILIEESQRSGAALIFGVNSVSINSNGIEPRNSAVFVRPDLGISGRYDKMHLVPFGEYVPLRNVFPFLKGLTPYSQSGGLVAGANSAIFEYRDWRMAPIICFEDTVPHLVREIVASGSDSDRGKSVDLLVNMTNDGWFHGSSELDQHLITAAFRAVECRTPMVRAVNTGISAVIDGDGAIREPEVFIDGDASKNRHQPPRTSTRDPITGAWHKQLNAALVDTVPLDNRRSMYVRYGDWFAMLCAASTLFAATSVVIPKRETAA